MSSAAAIWLANLERKVEGVRREVVDVRTGLRALEQGLKTVGPRRVGFPTGPQLATIDGRVMGCSNIGGPALIVVKDALGNVLESGPTAGDGSFTFYTAIENETVVFLQAFPDPSYTYAGRFTASSVQAVGLNPGEVTSLFVPLGIASGFHCSPFTFHPLKTTLNYTESFYGINSTLTWDPSFASGLVGLIPGAWTDCQMVAFPGSGACPAGNVPIRFSLQAFDFFLDWIVPAGSAASCPRLGDNCATLATYSFGQTMFNGVPAYQVDPAFTPTDVPFTIHLILRSWLIFNGATSNVVIWES